MGRKGMFIFKFSGSSLSYCYCCFPNWRKSVRMTGSRGPGFESRWRRNSGPYCTALRSTKPPFSSRYDLNNVERDVKHQIIIIIIIIQTGRVSHLGERTLVSRRLRLRPPVESYQRLLKLALTAFDAQH